MIITLRQEARKRSIASIQRYFAEELEEEIGDLKAGFLLDFFLEEIGPVVYNTAIGDAQKYFQQRTADLDGACFVPEFAFWTKEARRPPA